MSDPFYLADILLGRVGVLRSTAESIVLELCEAQAKLDAQTNAGDAGGAESGTVVALGSSEDALRLAIKNKLERVQTNLKLLRKLVPEFGAWGRVLATIPCPLKQSLTCPLLRRNLPLQTGRQNPSKM